MLLAELEPPGVGGDLEHVPRGRVVDEERGGSQLVVALAQRAHLAGAQVLAGPELVAVDPRPRAEQALGQLELAHFEADEQDGLLQVDG